MVVPIKAAHLSAHHTMTGVAQLFDMGLFDRLCEARPTTSAFIFIGGGEQRFPRNNIHIKPRFFVIKEFSRPGPFSPAFLGNPKLLITQRRDNIGIAFVFGHAEILYFQLFIIWSNSEEIKGGKWAILKG